VQFIYQLPAALPAHGDAWGSRLAVDSPSKIKQRMKPLHHFRRIWGWAAPSFLTMLLFENCGQL
jgi:hypothetical protein